MAVKLNRDIFQCLEKYDYFKVETNIYTLRQYSLNKMLPCITSLLIYEKGEFKVTGYIFHIFDRK